MDRFLRQRQNTAGRRHPLCPTRLELTSGDLTRATQARDANSPSRHWSCIDAGEKSSTGKPLSSLTWTYEAQFSGKISVRGVSEDGRGRVFVLSAVHTGEDARRTAAYMFFLTRLHASRDHIRRRPL
ncbi:hypothetical protein A0H81_05035 [Grifola frondosa]|uniref:Uncharacterized protein n=1 Tax=Grifola frondosa TaxID=5627 RepID=A0A1C7MFF3_GRIFR|nr:hypothetical protein A0H81_05035 [Grifola frondosa]